jgi:hypothetical protein
MNYDLLKLLCLGFARLYLLPLSQNGFLEKVGAQLCGNTKGLGMRDSIPNIHNSIAQPNKHLNIVKS